MIQSEPAFEWEAGMMEDARDAAIFEDRFYPEDADLPNPFYTPGPCGCGLDPDCPHD
jgi:hypothetical protein